MKIKDGASLAGLKIEMRPVLKAADSVWKEFGQELVVTCGLNGEHSAGSYHYYGYAVDLRTRYFETLAQVSKVARRLEAEIRFLVGAEEATKYRAVVEKTHLHVQFTV